MLALVTASTASLEPVAGFSHGVIGLVDCSPPPAPVAAEAALLAVEMVYLGVYFGGGARLGSRAQQCSAYRHSRAAPLVEAKTVLNWAVRVWGCVEAASSAASARLALAGATRAAKTRQRGAALARWSEAAAAVFCIPPPPTTHQSGERWYLREGPRRALHGLCGSSR